MGETGNINSLYFFNRILLIVSFYLRHCTVLETSLTRSYFLLQTLPDGSVVKINRTVISDTFDNGNGFFFHSTSFHNAGEPEDQYQDDVEAFEHEFSNDNNNNNNNNNYDDDNNNNNNRENSNEDNNNGEVPELDQNEEGEVELVSSSTTTTPTTTTTTTVTTTAAVVFSPRAEDDEAFNEILGNTKTSSTTASSSTSSNNKGIDDGLVTIEAVQ